MALFYTKWMFNITQAKYNPGYYAPLGWLTSKTLTILNTGHDLELEEFSFLLVECKMIHPSGRQFGSFSKHYHDIAIVFLNIYQNEVKTEVHTNIVIWIFMEVLLTIIKIWKQMRWPSMGEWLNKLWDTYTVNYYSIIKNELANHSPAPPKKQAP